MDIKETKGITLIALIITIVVLAKNPASGSATFRLVPDEGVLDDRASLLNYLPKAIICHKLYENVDKRRRRVAFRRRKHSISDVFC